MAREPKRDPIRWKLWLGLAALGVVCVSTGLAALRVQRFVTAGPQFRLSPERGDSLAIYGLRNTSRAKVFRVFQADVGRSIFAVPLAERRRRLLAIDWVKEASISRLWPDRLVARIVERTPVAFVMFRTGVLLVDAEGVLLEPPAQAQFAFPVLSGAREDESEALRRARVKAMLRLLEDLGPMAKDISEVNASETDNLKVVAQVNGKVLDLAMGDGSYARRYRNFLEHYPGIRRGSENATSFDLRLDGRITAKEQGP